MLPPSLNPSNQDKSNNSFSLSNLELESDFLKYQWEFTTCTEFCEAFGIRNKALLEAVFEKIKNLVSEGSDEQLFQQLYQDVHTPLFIKKIIAFQEFKAYLITRNAEHCISLLSEKISYCAHYKTQLTHIISLFKTKPVEACVALVRFTHSAETLPEGEQKNQLLWLIDQTRQAWYKENYLTHHALKSPFLKEYLNTNPQWTPCVDFILMIAKQNSSLSFEHYSELLCLIHLNSALFCEALSQTALIHQLDLTLLNDFILKNPNDLENLLKLTQHRVDRFTIWTHWLTLVPSGAALILTHWQNHLNHFSGELCSQEKVLLHLSQDIDNGISPLPKQGKIELEKTILSVEALKKPDLTNREKDKLPETKRHFLTEMALLFSVKTSCFLASASLLEHATMIEIYNRKIAGPLKTQKVEQTYFKSAVYNLYLPFRKPFSGNRIFEHTANESFKTSFLNGFKIFRKKEVAEQYFDHITNPKMTDAEFYERVLAKP